MSQLDKTFPTLDCSQCILTPKMVDVGRAANIELMTYSEVDAVEGYIGNFDVTIRKKARGVLSMPEAEARVLSAAAAMAVVTVKPVCPVIKPNEFEVGMKPRKAIYINHPQVVPLLYTIDLDSCIKCGLCVTACGLRRKQSTLKKRMNLSRSRSEPQFSQQVSIFSRLRRKQNGDTRSMRMSSRASSSSGSSVHPVRPAVTSSAQAMGRRPRESHSCSVPAPVTIPATANRTVHGSAACIP